jgi:hypothetical protein
LNDKEGSTAGRTHTHGQVVQTVATASQLNLSHETTRKSIDAFEMSPGPRPCCTAQVTQMASETIDESGRKKKRNRIMSPLMTKIGANFEAKLSKRMQMLMNSSLFVQIAAASIGHSVQQQQKRLALMTASS